MIMKRKTTFKKLRLFTFLILLTPLAALAQSTPNLYVCGTGQATFNPSFGAYTPVNGDQIIWTIDGTAQNAISYDGSNAGLQTSATLTTGTHRYTVKVIPADANLCPGEASDEIVLEKLPDPAIALSTPKTDFCTELASQAVITAAPNSITLPAGVTFTYAWTATLGATPVADITTIATQAGDKLTLKDGLAVGDYVFTATATYSTGGVPIVPAASCTAAANQNIKIAPKPGKATITIVP
ncbi:hypothetical protein SAMN04488023_14034 [Pedobacter rhizosphaerae]|uniref:Ig-like domain-containing protein n=2 Tax=Pedobacter rhizosphaerae TaxID=390241 RepID=A0A1H9VB47_9SPHI|nr:hypothetical protein SAMN04488023_14034 [Pedobacter rhizosphaerae]